MFRGAVIAALVSMVVPGCGRLGFDAGGDTAGSDSGTSTDAGAVPFDGATGAAGRPIFLQSPAEIHATGVTLDSAGNIYITGTYLDSFDLGGGSVASLATNTDAFVASFTPSGEHRWSWTAGATTLGHGSEIGVGRNGRVFVVGYVGGQATRSAPILDSGSRQQAFLLGFDTAGAQVTAESFGSNQNAQGRGLGVSPSGDHVGIAGVYGGDLDFGAGPLPSVSSDNGFAAVFDASGAHRWSTGHNGGAETRTTDIALDDAGVACVTGRFFGTIDFGQGPVRASGYDAFVAMYEPDGRLRWARAFGGAPNDFGLGVDRAPDGDCVAAGTLGTDDVTIAPFDLPGAGGQDMWVGRFDATTGATLYALRVGGASDDEAGAVAVDDSGRAVVAGRYASTTLTVGAEMLGNDGGTDGVVFGVSDAGDIIWVRHHGGSGDEHNTIGIGVALTPSGDEVVATGSFDGEKTIEGVTRTAMGGGDPYIYRFRPY